VSRLAVSVGIASLLACAREAAPPGAPADRPAPPPRAVVDPSLRARIVERRALVFTAPAAAELDRGDHVRAASGLAWLGDRLAIVQDDTSFVAVREPDGALSSVTLPAAADGRRRFESRRGNKNDKLDLESSLVIDGRLVAFGSGSLPPREVVVTLDPSAPQPVRVIDAAALYGRVRAALARDGEPWMRQVELNLEGAIVDGDRLRLFHRGNGAPAGVSAPADAVIDLERAGFVAWLDGGPAPPVRGVTWFDLGAAGAVRYGFTDATVLADGRVLFLASAEASPSAVEDGAVAGTRLGVLDEGGARTADLVTAEGAIAAVKGEGLVAIPGHRERVYVVLDLDDPDLPSELCTVELSGPW
jgi:hypothetical protein